MARALQHAAGRLAHTAGAGRALATVSLPDLPYDYG